MLSGARIPPGVQSGILAALPSTSVFLAQNQSLTPAVWEELYHSDNPSVLSLLLGRDYPPEVWARVASDLASGKFSSEVSLAVDSDLARLPNSLLSPLLGDLLSSGTPAVSARLLASLELTPQEKAKAAREALLHERLGWLTTSEAAFLSDDEAWELLTAPCKNPAVARGVRPCGTQVLLARPGLVSRAVRGPLRTLQMVACLELTLADQEALLATALSHRGGVDDEYTEVLRALHSAPWCAPGVLDRLAPLLGGRPQALPLASAPLSEVSSREASSLLKAPEALGAPLLTDPIPSQPYALLCLAKNPHLRRSARKRVTSLLREPSYLMHLGRHAYLALEDLTSTRTVNLDIAPGVFVPTAPLPTSRRPEADTPPSLEEALATQASSPRATSAFQAAFSSLEEDLPTWEAALSLLQDGFDGTAGELLELSRLLSR